MKKIIVVGILILVVAVTALAFAQGHGQMKMGQGTPKCQLMNELNEEQQAEFKEMRIKHFEKIQPLKLQIEKMNVELNELLIADQTNLSSIEKKIDEISNLKGEIQKKSIKNKLAMRELLDDTQKVMFNRHLLKNSRGHQRHGQGCGQGCGQRRQGKMGGQPFRGMPDTKDVAPTK